MIQERSQVDIDYERKKNARGRVGYGYFEYPDGTSTWIDPDHLIMSNDLGYTNLQSEFEREIDRRTLIVAMGA